MALEIAAFTYATTVTIVTASKIVPVFAAGATILARHHFNVPQLKMARRYSYAVAASNTAVIVISSYYMKDIFSTTEPSTALALTMAVCATTPVVLAIQHLVYYWGSLGAYHIGKTIVESMRQ